MFMLNDLSCCPQTLNAHISLPHAHIATCTCSIQLCLAKKYHPTPSQLLLYYTYSDHGIQCQENVQLSGISPPPHLWLSFLLFHNSTIHVINIPYDIKQVTVTKWNSNTKEVSHDHIANSQGGLTVRHITPSCNEARPELRCISLAGGRTRFLNV